MIAIVCTNYNLMLMIFFKINNPNKEISILTTYQLPNDVKIKLKKYFFNNIDYIEDKFEKKILNKYKHDTLLIFSHGNIKSLLLMNNFSGNIFLVEEGSYPYYCRYNKFDNFHELNFRTFIKRYFFKDRLVNYSKIINGIYLIRPELSIEDNHNIPLFKINLNIIKESEWNKIFEIFSIQEYRDNQKFEAVIFDSPILTKKKSDQESDVYIYEKIFDYLKDYRLLYRMNPYLNKKRDEILISIIKKYKNITIDNTNFAKPWELVFKKNINFLKHAVNIAPRCTTLFSINFMYHIRQRNIIFDDIFFKNFNYSQHIIDDYQEFRNYILSHKIKSLGIDTKRAFNPKDILKYMDLFQNEIIQD